MPEEDVTSNGAGGTTNGSRLRRPPLERAEPRRGWSNLYAPGKADAASREAPTEPAAATEGVAAAPADAATRVVTEGYRIVEENLRRGRQVAGELRGVRREVADFAGRIDAQKLVSELTQTVIDPALTQQMLGVAKTFFSALGAIVPGTTPAAAPAPAPAPAQHVPLHPQERAGYVASGARVLKLKATGPGEWLADVEIEGRVRRVQVRAVDGEL
jgi:hypothetical protein